MQQLALTDERTARDKLRAIYVFGCFSVLILLRRF